MVNGLPSAARDQIGGLGAAGEHVWCGCGHCLAAAAARGMFACMNAQLSGSSRLLLLRRRRRLLRHNGTDGGEGEKRETAAAIAAIAAAAS